MLSLSVQACDGIQCPGDLIQTDCARDCQPTCSNPFPDCTGFACSRGCTCPDDQSIYRGFNICAPVSLCPNPRELPSSNSSRNVLRSDQVKWLNFSTESNAIDLVLLVDESGSLGVDSLIRRWPTVRDFIIRLLLSYDIGFNRVRVALAMFNDE